MVSSVCNCNESIKIDANLLILPPKPNDKKESQRDSENEIEGGMLIT